MKQLKNLTVNVLGALVLIFTAATAHAQDMVKFTSPAPASQTNNGTATVSLRLDGTADPSSLKVVANGKDVTNQFHKASCSAASCEISAPLNLNNGVVGGWNYLTATVVGQGGSAGSARAKFFSKAGDAVVSSAPLRKGSGLKGNATPIFPFNYYPPFTVHMYTAPNGDICVFTLCNANPYIWLMDRTTLTVTATQASPSVLPTLDSNTMVIVNLPGTAAQTIDFSSVGGTNFTAQGAPVPYNYTMVGYGGAPAGTATECYNGDTNTTWHGVEGNLVNVGRNTPLYTFVPDENPGFVIQPGATSSTITVGNVQTFNLGSVTPPNPVEPPGFTWTQYSSPDMGQATGGFWVLVLDPFLLQPYNSSFSTFYGTNCPSCPAGSAASAAQAMTSDLGTYFTYAEQNPNIPEARPIIFITTVGTPFNSQTGNADIQSVAYGLTLDIWNFGTSWYAFSDLVTANSPSFSMVGIPGTNLQTGSGAQRYSAPANPQAARWFSTTVDGDTGALKGIFKRNNQFLYTPDNVGNFDASTVPSNPTGDDLLAFALVEQLGSSQPVTWPMENGAAYQYLSAQIISQDFYGGAGCGAPQMVCNDIHFYYTGDQVDSIVNGVDPRTVPYPGDGQGFTQQDLSAVATQLNYEKTYLGNVRNFERWIEDVETNGSVNIGTALTSAATDVATQLNQATGVSQTSVAATPAHLTIDVINDAASVVSILGPADPAIALVGGFLRLSANLASTGLDYTGTKPKADPYVNQLGDLLSTEAGQAASSAVKFNSDMQVANGTFFNSIYGDWFRLQTIGLLTVNPDNQNWYIANAGTSSASYTPAMIASARRSFYIQTLPQYFEILTLADVPQAYYLGQNKSQFQIDAIAAGHFHSGLNTGLYSWYSRNTPGQVGCQDYIFVVLNSSVTIGNGSSDFSNAKNWGTGALGPTLMGPATDSSGLGQLALNRNFFYDSRILNIAYWTGDTDVPNQCGAGSLGSGTPRSATTAALTAAATSVATGGAINLHIQIDNVDSSSVATPTGLVYIEVGGTNVATIALASDHEVDYTLHASLLSAGPNQIVADYRGDGTHLGSVSAPIAITLGDPSFTITPAQATVNLSAKPNSQATLNVTLASTFGYTGPVQFSCSNVPQYVLCTFSNQELIAGATPQTTKAVFTMIGTLQSSNQQPRSKGMGSGALALIAFVGLAGMVFHNPKNRGALLVAILAVGLGASSCGGGKSSSPNPPPSVTPVTTTVMINATSGDLTMSQPIQLTVK